MYLPATAGQVTSIPALKSCRLIMLPSRLAASLRQRVLRQHHHRQLSHRLYANTTNPPTSRIERVEARLPRFLRRFITPLRTAPISHITAFLVLHEITAVVPLLGLAGAFHYYNWLPPYISEGAWVTQGTEKFGKYLRKKGWIEEASAKDRWFGRGEGGVRVVAELATAWAITKALLPLRLILSVWATPWFARLTVLPITNRLGRLLGRGKTVAATKGPVTSGAAGTGATGAGAVAKDPFK